MQSEAKARKLVNELLAAVSKRYHPHIPTGDIDSALVASGFNELDPAVFCGREGRMTEQVGPKSWLHMTWYKMEPTGRYEIVAYVS